MAQRERIHVNARKSQFVHFDGPQSCIYLTEDYPDLPTTEVCFAGCDMPNPDIGPLIRQWRPKHCASHTPQTMLDLRDAIWSQRNPSPKGGDVLLLAAGPSLAEQLVNIRRYHEYATVVALNRAALVYANPDVFFCLERQSKAEWFKHLDPRTATVCAPSTHSDIVDHFPAASRWYTITPWCAYDKWEDAPDWALGLPALPTCETTISAALAFCVLLEPKRIILVGTDHAWKVAADENGNLAEVREYYCDGAKWPGPPIRVAGVEGINGRLCAVSFFSQKHCEVTDACCRQIEKNRKIEIINASGHGILRHNYVNDFFFRDFQNREQETEKKKTEQLKARFSSERANSCCRTAGWDTENRSDYQAASQVSQAVSGPAQGQCRQDVEGQAGQAEKDRSARTGTCQSIYGARTGASASAGDNHDHDSSTGGDCRPLARSVVPHGIGGHLD